MKPGWIVLVNRGPFGCAPDFVVGPWRGFAAKFRAWWWATTYLSSRNPYGRCDIMPETCRIEQGRERLWPRVEGR